MGPKVECEIFKIHVMHTSLADKPLDPSPKKKQVRDCIKHKVDQSFFFLSLPLSFFYVKIILPLVKKCQRLCLASSEGVEAFFASIVIPYVLLVLTI